MMLRRLSRPFLSDSRTSMSKLSVPNPISFATSTYGEDTQEERTSKMSPPSPSSTSTRIKRTSTSADYFNGRRSFCLVLMVNPSQICRSFINVCKSACSEEINRDCVQDDNKLHFTIFAKRSLTYNQAMSIRYECHQQNNKHVNIQKEYRSDCNDSTSTCTLPIFHLTGLLDWSHCIALSTDTEIDLMLQKIQTNFSWKPNKTLHLTLYRMCRFNKEKKKKQIAFRKIRSFVETRIKMATEMRMSETGVCKRDKKRASKEELDYGSAKGTKIILKEMGAEYDGSDGRFFRVICYDPSV